MKKDNANDSPSVVLSNLRIGRYRSCQSTDLELGPGLHVLIGPNGAGKTTLLSAVRLLRTLSGDMSRPFAREALDGSSSLLDAKFDVLGQSHRIQSELRLLTNEHNEDEIVSRSVKWKRLSNRSRRWESLDVDPIFYYDFPGRGYHSDFDVARLERIRYFRYAARLQGQTIDQPSLSAASALIDFCSGIRYYSASQFTNPQSAPISFEVERGKRGAAGIGIQGHKRFLFDLYESKCAGSSEYKDFLSVVGPKGLKLVDSLEFKEVETLTTGYAVGTGGHITQQSKQNLLVVPIFAIGQARLSPSQLSEGTYKTIALLYYLLVGRGRLLLVEEPEVCVHPGLLSSIVSLIKTQSADRQIIVSTHSPQVLDEVSPESIGIVRRSADSGTLVTKLTRRLRRREIESLRGYLRQEGTLGEYWRHGGFEGD